MAGDPADSTIPNLSLRSSRSFCIALALCIAATLFTIWSVTYLPMTDLPMHTAQVYIWNHYYDPGTAFAQRYELNYFTPYLAGYGLARFCSMLMPLSAAMKMVLTIAVLAQPFALLALIRRAGGDTWWALAGFPLALGFSFRFGFLNFLLGIGPALLLVTLGLHYAQRPSLRLGVALALVAVLMFWVHLLLLVFACAVIACLILTHRPPTVKAAILRMLPLFAPVPIIALWSVLFREAGFISPVTTWSPQPLRRLVGFPMALGGMMRDIPATAFGVMLLALIATYVWQVGWRRINRAIAAPSLVGLAAYFLIPKMLVGVGYLYGRFASLAVMLFLPALPRETPKRYRVAIAVLSVSYIALCAYRFHQFDAATRSFDRVAAIIQPGETVLGRMISRDGFTGDAAYLHFADYCVSNRAADTASQTGLYFHALARYRAGKIPPGIPLGIEWEPAWFHWAEHRGYNYVLVRAESDVGDPAGVLFHEPEARAGMQLLAHEGAWWLYRPVIN